ncbi:YhgE/Pip domain-containing protein [Gordonia desulfuricans]|uniref:YhgE/Pip domain-containing protein n=1 Tax=Gordonia desulfuricans TaxID=89051 RepID=A0A7K3LMX0_9ACTN|nr:MULTISPECIES: YhgE/Pip domain-containing protein [Gordonia]EMP13856.1 membrane protein [Gordonia sp. NB41Y]NDK89592.1 YhgE/Pip domain-containing protein [Gordonia desulfuricans]WLP92580.1 YhgE/Pip domain-containing protein [Gordonia sp. NB41Y]
MLAAFSPGSDFKRYYRGRMPRLALIVIILMPLMYGALYLWAFWNPFDAVNKLPVALVNADRGATIEGKDLKAGDQVVTGLVDSKQLDLHLVSQEEAEQGVSDGKYYFSITLPEDFSESLTSATTDNPHSAQLIFTYNDATNYLSTVMGQDAALQVIEQVGAQVGQQTFDVVLNEATALMPKLKQVQSGVNELNSGMKTANTGAHELATNLVTAKDGAGQLASALGELDGVVDKATTPLLNALGQDQTGITAAELTATADRLATNTGTVSTQLNQAANGQSQAYQVVSSALAQLQRSSDPNMRALAQTLSPVQTFLGTQGLGPNANNQISQVRTDANALSEQLSNPNSPLRTVLALSENGGLRNDIQTLRSAAGELSSGANQLSTGLGELSTGADELADGTTQLAAGTAQLATGVDEGVKMIPHWSDQQKAALAKTLGQPVALQENVLNEAKTFGTGFAPFFFGLALFVGSIIAWMLFKPLQARPIAQGLNSFRVVLASYAPTFAVGILQATILYLVTVFAIGLKPVYPWATYGFMLLMVAMFMAMIQMFDAVFDIAVGRVVTLAFLMVMLTSAGGIYPVPTTTKPFQYIHWVDPMTYTVTGLRQLTVGGVDQRFWTALIVVIALIFVFLAITTLAARRNRQYNMDRLYPPVEV